MGKIMANNITETTISALSMVSASARYRNSEVIYYGNKNKMTFKTYKRPEYVPQDTDKFAVISPGNEFRPDIMSKIAYGTPSFWWKIMEVNNIFDIFDFKAGLNIRIPANVLG